MGSDVDYQLGREAWPGVSITFAEYDAVWTIDPDAPPRHSEDFYLSAAAGLRINEGWERIDSDLGPSTRRCLGFQAKADYFIEDLWADIIAAIMADTPTDAQPPVPDLPQSGRPARIIQYRARVRLMNYLVTIGKRLAISRHRKRKPLTGLPAQRGEDGQSHPVALADPNSTDPASNAERSESGQIFRAALADALGRLSSDQRFLLAMVYLRGAKQKEAAAMLGWTEPKTSRHLQTAIAQLTEALAGCGDPCDDASAMAEWSRVLEENLESVQEPTAAASVSTAKPSGMPASPSHGHTPTR